MHATVDVGVVFGAGASRTSAHSGRPARRAGGSRGARHWSKESYDAKRRVIAADGKWLRGSSQRAGAQQCSTTVVEKRPACRDGAPCLSSFSFSQTQLELQRTRGAGALSAAGLPFSLLAPLDAPPLDEAWNKDDGMCPQQAPRDERVPAHGGAATPPTLLCSALPTFDA